MDWIDDNVAVGDRWDAFWRRLKKDGVEVVVDTRPFFDQKYGKYDRTPNVPKVLKAAELVLVLSQHGAKVLVRCNEGKDRSAFVTMIYVSKRYGLSYRDAYDRVKEHRKQTVFHWDWVDMLPKETSSDRSNGSDRKAV
jgi:hypothetical protein